MPERIQLRRTKGWRKPPGAIVVARPTKWGNPAVVGQPITFWHRVTDLVSGRIDSERTTIRVTSRTHAVAIFRALLTDPWAHMDAWGLPTGWQDQLRGHDLACWCPLDQPCHADVLLEIANQEPTI